LFGFGPGSFTRSRLGYHADQRLDKFILGYGMTALTYVALECGVLGVIVYLIIILTFLRMCWKYYFLETDPYWRAFAVGSLGLAFFMIFLFCGYNYNSYTGDSFPLFYFYIMGVIFVRLNKRLAQ
jgi:ABC-type xylose transport system permease subunit